jgi:hypothetical protein
MSNDSTWYHIAQGNNSLGAAPRGTRAKAKRLGRPRVVVDAQRIAQMRQAGASWPAIAATLGASVGTAWRASRGLSNTPQNVS